MGTFLSLEIPMRTFSHFAVGLLLFLPFLGCQSRVVSVPILAPPSSPVINFDGTVFTVEDPDILPHWKVESPLAADKCEAVFAVYVGEFEGPGFVPPLMGTCTHEGHTLRFEPRFPLKPGVTYSACYDPTKILEVSPFPSVVRRITLPKPHHDPTVIRAIYPGRETLPENQLRFYIHFSAPMARGEAYEHITLLGSDGKPVDHPFLELGEELWDPQGLRFTLLIDPGRIKRGLKPREEVGPALEQGKSYTLVIDKAWRDAEGEPLKDGMRKAFRVGAPDETQPDPKTWKILGPQGGMSEPLTVSFPESLDHAMLLRVLKVQDRAGVEIEGTPTVSEAETRWHFRPANPWKPGAYQLVVDAALEDLAGNSIARPFEVDEVKPIQTRVETRWITLPFEIPGR